MPRQSALGRTEPDTTGTERPNAGVEGKINLSLFPHEWISNAMPVMDAINATWKRAVRPVEVPAVLGWGNEVRTDESAFYSQYL